MFHKKPTEKQIIGRIGEDFACDYLRNKGYKIIDRNYLRKWGEIDIVAKDNKKLYFVEVKTVSRLIGGPAEEAGSYSSHNVAHETPVVDPVVSSALLPGSLQGRPNDYYRPEDNVHPWKLQRMGRVIQSYLLDKDVSDETEWQFDLITVYLDKDKRLVKIETLDDIVL